PRQKACPAEASRGSFRGEGAGWVPRAASAAGACLSASSFAAGREAPKTSHRPASFLVLALAATVARARAAEERREEPLGEVVVTAPLARESVPVRDPTAFATVVDTTSAPTRVETLAEALADTVRVQVRRFGGLGDFSTVWLLGRAGPGLPGRRPARPRPERDRQPGRPTPRRGRSRRGLPRDDAARLRAVRAGRHRERRDAPAWGHATDGRQRLLRFLHDAQGGRRAQRARRRLRLPCLRALPREQGGLQLPERPRHH